MDNRVRYWNALEDYPDRVASLFHMSCGDDLRQRIARLSPSGICADLACGPGYWLNTLGDAERIYAVDFSAGMLTQARTRAPDQTVFIEQNLRDLDLPEQVDFALCFNGVMPESHSDALRMLGRIAAALAPNGRLMMVLPSIEALLYTANALHFSAAQMGLEAQSLRERLDTWLEWSANPLGYVRNGNGTIVKYWQKDEAEVAFSMSGDWRVVERFRVLRDNNANGECPPEHLPKAWFHGWVLQK